MNRTELVDAVADNAGLSKSAAYKAVYAVFDTITDALKAGGEVRVAGFGIFEVSERTARTGRNPRTGEEVEIAASKQARFKRSKALKDALNPEPAARPDRVGPPRRRQA